MVTPEAMVRAPRLSVFASTAPKSMTVLPVTLRVPRSKVLPPERARGGAAGGQPRVPRKSKSLVMFRVLLAVSTRVPGTRAVAAGNRAAVHGEDAVHVEGAGCPETFNWSRVSVRAPPMAKVPPDV